LKIENKIRITYNISLKYFLSFSPDFNNICRGFLLGVIWGIRVKLSYGLHMELWACELVDDLNSYLLLIVTRNNIICVQTYLHY
jgi:hypothetical protein